MKRANVVSAALLFGISAALSIMALLAVANPANSAETVSPEREAWARKLQEVFHVQGVAWDGRRVLVGVLPENKRYDAVAAVLCRSAPTDVDWIYVMDYYKAIAGEWSVLGRAGCR